MQQNIYSTAKVVKRLTHTAKWMDLENMMLVERKQSQKATGCAIPLIGND